MGRATTLPARATALRNIKYEDGGYLEVVQGEELVVPRKAGWRPPPWSS